MECLGREGESFEELDSAVLRHAFRSMSETTKLFCRPPVFNRQTFSDHAQITRACDMICKATGLKYGVKVASYISSSTVTAYKPNIGCHAVWYIHFTS